VQPLYRDMLAAESKAGAKHAIEAGTQVLRDRLTQHDTDYAHFVLGI